MSLISDLSLETDGPSAMTGETMITAEIATRHAYRKCTVAGNTKWGYWRSTRARASHPPRRAESMRLRGLLRLPHTFRQIRLEWNRNGVGDPQRTWFPKMVDVLRERWCAHFHSRRSSAWLAKSTQCFIRFAPSGTSALPSFAAGSVDTRAGRGAGCDGRAVISRSAGSGSCRWRR